MIRSQDKRCPMLRLLQDGQVHSLEGKNHIEVQCDLQRRMFFKARRDGYIDADGCMTHKGWDHLVWLQEEILPFDIKQKRYQKIIDMAGLSEAWRGGSISYRYLAVEGRTLEEQHEPLWLLTHTALPYLQIASDYPMNKILRYGCQPVEKRGKVLYLFPKNDGNWSYDGKVVY